MSRPFALRAQRQTPEQDVQKHVVAMLDAYLPSEIWFSASMAGIPLPPHVARRAKDLGNRRGCPDLMFVLPDGSVHFIELKAPGGVLTPEQAVLALTLGPRFAVCHSWPEVRAELTPWLARWSLRWLTDTESLQRSARVA